VIGGREQKRIAVLPPEEKGKKMYLLKKGKRPVKKTSFRENEKATHI